MSELKGQRPAEAEGRKAREERIKNPTNSQKRERSPSGNKDYRHKRGKHRREDPPSESSNTPSSSESDLEHSEKSSNGEDAEGLIRAQTSKNADVIDNKCEGGLSQVLDEIDQEYANNVGPNVDDQVAKVMTKRWGQQMDIKVLEEKMAKYNCRKL